MASWKKRKRRRPHSATCSYDRQEPRHLLAGIQFDPGTGIVHVDGSALDDVVQVSEQQDQLVVSLSQYGQEQFLRSDVSRVIFVARAGNDWFRNQSSVDVRAYGQLGDDILIGGEGNDRFRGGPGRDVVRGNGGDDFVAGDQDDDYLHAGAGTDRVVGGDGNDRLFGGDGDDTLLGGEGDDYGRGGNGNDSLYGYHGNDQLLGDSGDDIVAGQDGDDVLLGNDGFDRLFGNEGHDSLSGGNDDDWLAGGNGDDRISGQSGRDRMFGQFGDDWLAGGDDNDEIRGDDGHDDIFAGSGDDLVWGGKGLDRLLGQDGSDQLDGGDDGDDLDGGLGADRLRGGAGNDDYISDSDDSLDDDSDDYSPFGDFEIRGEVTGYHHSNQTFSVLGIPVDAARAEFRTAISEGDFVKVEGTYFDGTLTAHEVELEFDTNRTENFEARGVISELNTSQQTFRFHGFVVNYQNARMETNLANGNVVAVEGRLSENTIAAHEIEGPAGAGQNDQQDQIDGQLELRGNIFDFDNGQKTFSLLGIPVDFGSAEIRGAIGNGVHVKMDGFYDGQRFLARQIELELDQDRDENLRGRGIVENLDSSTQEFDFLGFRVQYSGAELETSLANGDSIEVRGWLNNFLVIAEEVRS